MVDGGKGGTEQAVGEARTVRVTPRTPDAWQELGLLAFRKRELAAAVKCFERAIVMAPERAVYRTNFGVVLRAAGETARAEEQYREAIALEASDADAHNNLGNILLAKGDLAGAADCFRRAVELRPDFTEALNNLGITLVDAGDLGGARETFQRVLGLRPDYAPAHTNMGNLLLQDERHDDALGCFERALALDAGNAEARRQRVKTLFLAERLGEAERACREALGKDDEDAFLHLLLAQILVRAGRRDEAEAATRRALELDRGSAHGHAQLGAMLFRHRDDYDGALVHLRNALELSPENLEAKSTLTSLYVTMGRIDEAEALLREILARDPNHVMAYRQLAHIRKAADGEDAEVNRMEALLADPALGPARRIELNYALADACDAAGRYARAFECLKAANDADLARHPYDAERARHHFEALKSVYEPALFAATSGFGSDSELPVFVVGMPRSGTTLTEQIIASHGEAHGAGELREIADLRRRVHEAAGGALPYPAAMQKLTAETAREIADGHVAHLRNLAPEARRVVDKMPFNFYALGLIAVLFPRARIVHCRRNPLDTCLSCYFLRFADHMSFAMELGYLGRFYRDYEDLMAHWQRVLPAPVFTVQYEDLVADQEGASRRLIEFCGLDWDPACLAFFETERPVKTASNWQVRQPIYATSVGRWKNYEAELAPLIDALGLTAADRDRLRAEGW